MLNSSILIETLLRCFFLYVFSFSVNHCNNICIKKHFDGNLLCFQCRKGFVLDFGFDLISPKHIEMFREKKEIFPFFRVFWVTLEAIRTKSLLPLVPKKFPLIRIRRICSFLGSYTKIIIVLLLFNS